jgi:hypothetical protein
MMFERFTRQRTKETPIPVVRPTLDLSGPLLKSAMESLVFSCEDGGGVERYVEALKFKTSIFQDAFRNGPETLRVDQFAKLCMFMPTVRRRVSHYFEADAFPDLREALTVLFKTDHAADAKLEAFCAKFPRDKTHRWVRDLAAEILHGTDPERWPLMGRWVWDRASNSGVIREIWYGDNVDNETIKVDDDLETYLVLREELSQYLTENGVFHDVLVYIDLICGHIYAQYIAAQGGTFLRADFAAQVDLAVHTRRILGLDGVRAKSAHGEAIPIEGDASQFDQLKQISGEE